MIVIIMMVKIFCLLQSLQLLVTFCWQSYFPTDWCWWGWADPDFRLFVYSKATSQARPPAFSLKILPQIGRVSKLRLKVDHLKLGLNWDRIWCWNLGKGGEKRPFVVILNYPVSMSACMCFPPFSPQSGLWPPETEMGWRQRPSIDSTCSDHSNFLPHTCMPAIGQPPS